MPNFSDGLLNEYVPSAIDLLRFSESERITILILLQQMVNELRQKLMDAELDGKANDATARWAALKKQAELTIASGFKSITAVDKEVQQQIAQWAGPRYARAVNNQVGVEIASIRMTPATLKRIVDGSLIRGHPASAWWAKQAQDVQFAFEAQMQMGLLAGETNAQLVKRLIGSATGKSIKGIADGRQTTVREYTGGILQVSRREATALVRTSAMAVSNATNQEFIDQNSDIFIGVQIIVTLDLRTCLYCMGLSGGAWDFEGKPLPQSKVSDDFPGRPPYHFNDRCVILPILKTWQQILEESGRKLKVKLSELAPQTRASMDGQVAAEITYEEWLRQREKAHPGSAAAALGPARARLFLAGKLSISDLTDPTGRELTLDELMAR